MQGGIKKTKVAIATTFNSYDNAYSLINVVADQIRMLQFAGYSPVVLVQEGFKPEDVFKDVELRELPAVRVYNEVKVDDTFEEDQEALYQSMKKHLEDIKVIITHDWIYQPDALKHQVAARRIAKEDSSKRWLHWIHSATTPHILATQRGGGNKFMNMIQEDWPNSYICFPNSYSAPRVASHYNVSENRVKTVHHPTDIPSFFGFDETEFRFWREKKLWLADAIAVAPARLDRGKQIEWVIKIMAALKHEGQQVRVVVVDFHSTGGDKVNYREELKQLGIDWGLNPLELSFTSEFSDKWGARVPRKTIDNFFAMSNVFILPSRSETYSLVAQEAALRGNLLVLNKDFPPFRDIYGPSALYHPFSSNIDKMTGMDGETTTSYTSERDFAVEVAREIKYHLENDFALKMRTKLRKERTVEAVAQNEFIPIIEGI
ncbi:MAG: YqgM-like protein [Podoviridae sp. ctg2L5]|nr:MAG: YqgM-like protein [Podoviridae sp. ctg2L5]